MGKTGTKGKHLPDLSLQAFGLKLANKILMASSADAVHKFVHTGVKAVVLRSLNGYIIIRFIERVCFYLSAMQSSVDQQKENKEAAICLLQQWKNSIEGPAGLPCKIKARYSSGIMPAAQAHTD